MNKRMKSGSWANLRAFSVNNRDKLEKINARDGYVDDNSNSFESTDCNDSEHVWNEDLGTKKSFSHSTIGIHRKRSANSWANETNAGDQTPMSKRRSSVKRIFARRSTSSAPNVPAGQPDKSEALKRKDKATSKRDSLFFNLYAEALENGLLSNEELDIWNIQVRFPNDDLRFYEGIFTLAPSDTLAPPTTVSPPPSPTLLAVPERHTGRSFHRDKQSITDGFDVPYSPAVPRKLVPAKATVHSMSTFHHNRNPAPPPEIATKLPVFQRLSPALQAKFKKMAQRRQSAPSIVIRGVLGRSAKPPYAFSGKEDNSGAHSPNTNHQRLSLKFGSQGATLNLTKREYVMEGKVQLTAGMQTQDRYFFLFTDLLVIAKAKSGSNYKLKYRIRICELWTAACLDDVCELPKLKDDSFVIGWPTTNFVATFSNPESKEMWHNVLVKKIQEEKQKETPKVLTLKIINRDASNISHIKMLKVSHKDTAQDVVRNAVEEFGFEEDKDQYQLWVVSKKENTAYPLIGHENPHAIQLNHIRDFIAANGILEENKVKSVAKFENMIEPEIRDRCQFILRNNQRCPKYNADITGRRISRIKAKTSAAIFNWGRKRPNQRNENSDSGHVSGNSVGSEGTPFFPSSPLSTSPPATPKLFSLPLGQVCDNAALPFPIAAMFDILYRKGPYTCGIFRKSANEKVKRQLKHKLNEDIETDLEEQSIHVVAALIKDFMRNIPDSVLDCNIYDKWTAAIRNSNDAEKLKSVRRLLTSLDACNRVLVRRLAIVLNRIASKNDRNMMTSRNLALCISPSLLWPMGPSCQAEPTMKVTEILQYFIDNCEQVFDGIAPTDMNWPQSINYNSDNDDEYEGDIEKLSVDDALSPVSDILAASRDFGKAEAHKDEDDDSDANHFVRTRMTRRQFQRRKTNSRIDAARLMSLSQDSLDKVLMDVDHLPPDHRALDDIVLNESDMSGSHHIRKRGKGYLSNDSGFTTLSGEDEDHLAGSRLDDFPETRHERVDHPFGDLRGLWAPGQLNIVNGQILDDVELNGIEEEGRNEFAAFQRRKSQPAAHRRRKRTNSSNSGAAGKPAQGSENAFRLSDAIEYHESDGEGSPFVRKPPTYIRLKDQTSNPDPEQSENTARQYTAGVTVAVGDVRPPERTSYRPVTLSIRDMSRTRLSYEETDIDGDFKSRDNAEKPSPFFIRDEESPDSNPDSNQDATSSSQEDVFGSFEADAISSWQSRGRSKTEGELIVLTPKTAPVRRKFDPAQRAQFEVPTDPFTESAHRNERITSIQKLTENLQQMPDFSDRNGRKKSAPCDAGAGFARKSLRESRRSQPAILKSALENVVDLGDLDSTARDLNLKSIPSISVTDCACASPHAEESPADFERNVISRRPYGRRRTHAASNGHNAFSHSLPASQWHSLKGNSERSKQAETGLENTKDTRISSDDSQASKVHESSVKSIVTTHNHMTNPANSQAAFVGEKIRVRRKLGVIVPPPDLDSKSSPKLAAEQASICVGSSVEKAPRSGLVIRSVSGDASSINESISVQITAPDTYNTADLKNSSPRADSESISVQISAPEAYKTPDLKNSASQTGSESISLQISSSDTHQTPGSRNTAPRAEYASVSVEIPAHHNYQTSAITNTTPRADSGGPISDEFLYSLSESFAFGNKKTEENTGPDARESPISTRRRRYESRHSNDDSHKTAALPVRRRRHYSVDRCSDNSTIQQNHIHVTSISVTRSINNNESKAKRLNPPTTPKMAPRDKNANDLLPFIGIIQSEESYV